MLSKRAQLMQNMGSNILCVIQKIKPVEYFPDPTDHIIESVIPANSKRKSNKSQFTDKNEEE